MRLIRDGETQWSGREAGGMERLGEEEDYIPIIVQKQDTGQWTNEWKILNKQQAEQQNQWKLILSKRQRANW